MRVKNKLKVLIIIFIFIIITLFLILMLKKNIDKRKINNEYLEYLNNGKKLEFMNDSAIEFRNYIITDEKFREVNIDAAINYYINLILHIKFNNDFYNENAVFGDDSLSSPNCYPLNDSTYEYIKNLIDNENGINDENLFKKTLVNQLENIFDHKSIYDDKEWYIRNDKNKIIELPYNVYIDFVSDKKDFREDFKELKKLDIDKKNKKYIAYYINDKNELIEFESTLGLDENNNVRINSFSRIYLKDFEKSKLTFGQHDYDLAKKKHWEDVWNDVEAAGGFPGHTNEE